MATFIVGDVRGVRVRGSDWPRNLGIVRGRVNLRKYGWVLTHKPTGRQHGMPPSAGAGVPKKGAMSYAKLWAKHLAQQDGINDTAEAPLPYMPPEPTKKKPKKHTTAASAWADGLVWVSVSFSGGEKTPLLGPGSIKAKGAKDPETAFLMYMLFCGHTVESAQKALDEARTKA